MILKHDAGALYAEMPRKSIGIRGNAAPDSPTVGTE
jgi:hypothetical protein